MFFGKKVGDFNKKGIWKPYIYWLRDSERLFPYNGGEIWIENLDGMYGYEELVLCKLDGDIKSFTRPSSTSYICFVFYETIVTEHIIDAVKRSVLECGKRFVKIAFVGLDKKSKRRLKNELKGKGFVVNFLEGLEDAKQWLL